MLFGLSSTVGWVGYVARTGRGRDMHTGLWWAKLKGRDHLEEIRLDGKIIPSIKGGLKEIGLINSYNIY